MLDKALDVNGATTASIGMQGDQITATAGLWTADTVTSPSTQHSDDAMSTRASSPHGAPMTGTNRAHTCKAKLP